MGAPFHANWRHGGQTINFDRTQDDGESTSHFIRRIIDDLTAALQANPPDNS